MTNEELEAIRERAKLVTTYHGTKGFKREMGDNQEDRRALLSYVDELVEENKALLTRLENYERGGPLG
jgi:hypothetical protein